MKTKEKQPKKSKKTQDAKNTEDILVFRELGRIMAGSYYDHQHIRIQEWNRVRDIIYRKMEGINLTELQKKKPEEQKYLEKFKDIYLMEYKRILHEEGKLTLKEVEYLEKIFSVLKNAEKHEQECKKLMMEFVENEDIYHQFLNKIRGISAVLSSNLIKEFGYCEKAPYISSLWRYSGMHVVGGVAPKRKKGEKLEFNLKIRTMVWKIGDSFIKQRTPFYRDIYDKEKSRQISLMENSKKDEDNLSIPKSLMHCDLRARRKMVKIFLAHYWQACKELKHENNIMPYAENKMGHKHITSWEEAVLAQVKKRPDEVIKANKIKKPIRK